jgi:hypothetical protein
MNFCRILIRFLFAVSIFLTAGVASGQWKDTLPQNIRDSVLWYGDHEEGSLADYLDPGFQYKGGGIYFNHYDDNTTGGSEEEAVADTTQSHSGQYSVRATITNAYHANGSRAVRLMRWTDRAWDDGGQYFPTEAYYSAWYYSPYKYNPNKYDPGDPGDARWWNIMQFKSIGQPTWMLNVDHDDTNNYMYFYLYSKYNPPNYYSQLSSSPIPVPVGRWFHIEAFVRKSDTNGQIKIWQDGVLLFDVDNVLTAFMVRQDPGSLRYQIVWGTGNYTDHITGYPGEDGKATLYIDDAIVSTERVSSVLSQPAAPTGLRIQPKKILD